MRCEKCNKAFMPGGEEMNLPTGFRIEISQDHATVTAFCNQCNSKLRTFSEFTVAATPPTTIASAKKSRSGAPQPSE